VKFVICSMKKVREEFNFADERVKMGEFRGI